jgi:hypothetical protein
VAPDELPTGASIEPARSPVCEYTFEVEQIRTDHGALKSRRDKKTGQERDQGVKRKDRGGGWKREKSARKPGDTHQVPPAQTLIRFHQLK